MRVLFVASECAPFVKTGGLADVVAALPRALEGLGLSVKLLLPAYPALAGLAGTGEELLRVRDPAFGLLRVVGLRAEGLNLLLLVVPKLFERPGNPYLGPDGRDWPDNALRFAALGRAAARIAAEGIGGWKPEILHAHDWQAGLAPAYLRAGADSSRAQSALAGETATGTVTTIHNIAFQGLFPAERRAALDLPASGFTIEGFEYHGSISFLKAGLVWSDRITTVSPSYARELLTPAFGMGFEGILAARRAELSGILNGVDLETWNPETDPSLAATYTPRNLSRRALNRQALMQRFGIELAPDAPLFCVVSRLTRQKGLDLLLEVLPQLLAGGAGLVLLGSGDADLEAGFLAAAGQHPTRIGVRIGYDEPLSHLMQGGADCILIPSRFEPCGLTQLYGLRYGCIPLVARTGGLADSVIDANEAAELAGVATGFQFAPVTAEALRDAIQRVLESFADRAGWQAMMRRAMRHPVGWERSAERYRALYLSVRDERAGREPRG